MTEKEAIYILRNAAWLGSDAERQKVEEAVEVVAKAIEAQDMILHMNLPEVSVEEAIEILKRNNRIELLPPAQPEKGEWIDVQVIPFTNNDGQLICEKICSRCHGIAYFRSTFDGIIANNFCPNCGTPMKRGEQE